MEDRAGRCTCGVAAHDLLQRRYAILRNFPVVGHARFWLESIGPELRQYIVAGNDEERPFSRDPAAVGLVALMETSDETEVRTEGPPEIAVEGTHGDVMAGDESRPG